MGSAVGIVPPFRLVQMAGLDCALLGGQPNGSPTLHESIVNNIRSP